MSGLSVTVYAHVDDDTEILAEAPGATQAVWTVGIGPDRGDVVLFFRNRADLTRLRDAVTAALDAEGGESE
ncbi:MAG: hypothetical protein AB7R99_29990 [Pseudonocardia sp.]